VWQKAERIKCPAFDSFGVAQSPKSSSSGTTKMIVSSPRVARENFGKKRNFFAALFV
jgi:hypothetical protein